MARHRRPSEGHPMTRKQPLDYDASPLTYLEHQARRGGPWRHPAKSPGWQRRPSLISAAFVWAGIVAAAVCILFGWWALW